MIFFRIQYSHSLVEMQLWTVVCILWLTCLALGNADERKIFCYYNSTVMGTIGYAKMNVSNIDPSLCTHLLYLAVGITKDDNVSILNPSYDLPDNRGKAGFENLNALRKQNAKLKTLISSANPGHQAGENFRSIMASPSRRSKYVKNIVDFLLRHKFDGIDLRTDYPGQRKYDGSSNNYVLLLKELRSSLDEHKLILSVGLDGSESRAAVYYDIPGISKYVHFILLHVKHGYDGNAAHRTALYPASNEISSSDRSRNTMAMVRYWLNRGASAEKLILGTGFGGYSYYILDSIQHERGSLGNARKGDLTSTRSVEYLSYTEICLLTSSGGWVSKWDEEQRVPYSYSGYRWITYDNARSLTENVQYVRAMGLGGVMVWTIDMDDRTGQCGERAPLLKALNRAWRMNGCSAVPESNMAAAPKANSTDDLNEDARAMTR